MRDRRFASVLASLLLAACTTVPTPDQRRAHADALAHEHGWTASQIPAGAFVLTAYAPTPLRVPAGTLTVYLEGDGLAWLHAGQPSADPTPRDPLALRLALRHPAGAAPAVYLARPCQYAHAAAGACPSRYWTGERFAADVVEATSAAIDRLKERFGADRLVLVGYSGGAAVAALVAARRTDVGGLVSVAGNLDLRAWVRHHALPELKGSLDPADAAPALARIPQVHFTGERDAVVPPRVAASYAGRFPAAQRPAVIGVPDFDHVCCWVERWPSLFGQAAAAWAPLPGAAR